MTFDPSGFSITACERNCRAVLVLRGELDLATAPQLEQAVAERLDAGTDVVVDLRELAFMDSTGLRVLVAAHARKAADQRFEIVRPPADSAIAKILSIAGLESELELIDDA